ncbi:MFS transporter [Kineococcus sp. SYSU DK018]|uniref:MFS transporter n=1 Tax=Kineococcus sp. SYSU DK018 TaxID=3383139 RepID=UPI003D7DBB55
MTTTLDPSSPSTALGPRRRWTILAVCASSLFLVGLDTTVVNAALPSIAADLGAGALALQWIVDAYTIVFASLLITSGALADRFGRRRTLLTGMVVFAVASAACALATGAGSLVAARALQGVGASMLTPVALAIVVTAMPDPRERARAIGVWSSVFGLSTAVGPLVGGALLTTTAGWRGVFWLNVPVAAAAVVLVLAVVPESRAPRPRPLDPRGQLLLAGVLALGVGLLIEAPHLGWTSPATIGLGAVLLAGGAAFVACERRVPQPLVDPSLFLRWSFTAAVLGAVALFTALSATLLFTTYHLQVGLGWDALTAGTALLPLALGALVCGPPSGALVARFGPRPPLLVAALSTATGGVLAWSATQQDGTRVPVLLLGHLLIGVGLGFGNAPITNTAVSGLPPARSGVAAGIASTARQVGSAVGIALAGGAVAGERTVSTSVSTAVRGGWWLVVGCGVLLLATAAAARRRDPVVR